MNNEIKYWYLRDHKLFWVLNNEQLKQLCVITNYKKAKKGDIIYFANEDAPRIYFLKKGNIKVADVDESGNEVIKEILQKGDLFGELGFEQNSKSTEYAEVLTNEVIICSFYLSDFEALMEKYPTLAVSYIKIVGFRFKKLQNNYRNLIFKDAKSRFVQFIKDWAEREGKQENGKIILQNYLTQQDIAHIICTSRQTATQLISEFETKGWLEYGRKEIIIENLTYFG
jgi:CRP/FNR family transcriptional regulator